MAIHKTEKISVSDDISFWDNGRQMHGNVIEPRNGKFLVRAWPVHSPTTKREYLVEDYRLSLRSVELFKPIPIISKIEGGISVVMTFSMYIGDIERNFRMKITCPGTMADLPEVMKDHVIKLPYTNSIGKETFLVTNLDRISKNASNVKTTFTKRKEDTEMINVLVS